MAEKNVSPRHRSEIKAKANLIRTKLKTFWKVVNKQGKMCKIYFVYTWCNMYWVNSGIRSQLTFGLEVLWVALTYLENIWIEKCLFCTCPIKHFSITFYSFSFCTSGKICLSLLVALLFSFNLVSIFLSNFFKLF